MKKNIEKFRKGYLDMLLLKVLSEGDYYGYEIIQIFRELSNNVIDITAGNIYPVLYKMEEAGYIHSYAVKSGPKMQRYYYHLTDAGKGALEEMLVDYRTVTEATNSILSCNQETSDHRIV